MFLQLMLSEDGERFRPVSKEDGLVMTGRVEWKGDTFVVCDLCDQDYIHNQKKLVNTLGQVSRDLQMGNYSVHMNFLEYVYEHIPRAVHGLTIDDIMRRDRQNYRTAQKIVLLRVQSCLEEIMTGHEGNRARPDFQGMLIYIKVAWMYGEIFCSKVTPISTKIKYAAAVSHFLAIRHNWVYLKPELKTACHFISWQTYADIVISTSYAVSLISYMGKMFPIYPLDWI